jgi:hypothetical protein
MSLFKKISGWDFVRNADGVGILKKIQKKAEKYCNESQSHLVSQFGSKFQ